MPLYNVPHPSQWSTTFADIDQVTLKENASAAELDKAKEKAKSDGGEIKHEFTLIKGFTFATPGPSVIG
jgi:hypothetical protein